MCFLFSFSLCNNGGLDAARLAESCGHDACSQFLQSAVAQREHTLTNGTAMAQPRNTTDTENGDCEMEVTDSVTNGYASGGVGDVTLTCDVSASITRMAGRKRSWDCGGVGECKRMRRTGESAMVVAHWEIFLVTMCVLFSMLPTCGLLSRSPSFSLCVLLPYSPLPRFLCDPFCQYSSLLLIFPHAHS